MSLNQAPVSEDAIRSAIRETLPGLADAPIELLGEGWAFIAYRVGDTVLRFPLDAQYVDGLDVEAAVMRELAPALPLPVSVIQVHDDGPNRLPFTSHRLIPGVPVGDLQRPLVPGAGAVVGRFLRALHAFPVEHAAALGLTNPSPDGFRAQRADFYAKVQALVLPRVDEITAAYTMQRFEAFLNDPASFDWMPCVSHADIDARNVLADPDTGEITGVIDWGDIRIGDPAGEFTGILFAGLGRAGLLNQLPALIGGYGMTPGELERVQERCRFYYFCWPLNEAIHGIEHDKADFIESGLEWLCRLAREGGA